MGGMQESGKKRLRKLEPSIGQQPIASQQVPGVLPAAAALDTSQTGSATASAMPEIKELSQAASNIDFDLDVDIFAAKAPLQNTTTEAPASSSNSTKAAAGCLKVESLELDLDGVSLDKLGEMIVGRKAYPLSALYHAQHIDAPSSPPPQ